MGLCDARHIFHRHVWYRALSLRYVRAMPVFDILASSSPLGYLYAKCRFVHGPHR